jgi:hypothetical protein
VIDHSSTNRPHIHWVCQASRAALALDEVQVETPVGQVLDADAVAFRGLFGVDGVDTEL